MLRSSIALILILIFQITTQAAFAQDASEVVPPPPSLSTDNTETLAPKTPIKPKAPTTATSSKTTTNAPALALPPLPELPSLPSSDTSKTTKIAAEPALPELPYLEPLDDSNSIQAEAPIPAKTATPPKTTGTPPATKPETTTTSMPKAKEAEADLKVVQPVPPPAPSKTGTTPIAPAKTTTTTTASKTPSVPDIQLPTTSDAVETSETPSPDTKDTTANSAKSAPFATSEEPQLLAPVPVAPIAPTTSLTPATPTPIAPVIPSISSTPTPPKEAQAPAAPGTPGTPTTPTPAPTPTASKTLPTPPAGTLPPPTEAEIAAGVTPLPGSSTTQVSSPSAATTIPAAQKPAAKTESQLVQELLAKVGSCKDFPKKLAICEAYTCTQPDMFSVSNDSNFQVTRQILGYAGDKCKVTDTLPKSVHHVCKYSEASRKAFSWYFDQFFTGKPVDLDNTENSSNFEIIDYANKKECQYVLEEDKILSHDNYKLFSSLPDAVPAYGAVDAPEGNCDEWKSRIKTCEPFYCKGTTSSSNPEGGEPIAKGYERKIIGTLGESCAYVEMEEASPLRGCSVRAEEDSVPGCSATKLYEIAKMSNMFALSEAEEAAGLEEVFGKRYLPTLPKLNYKTENLSPLISKKSYDDANKHLPPTYYPNEFVTMLFRAIEQGDFNGTRTLIAKNKELGNTAEPRGPNQNTPLLHSIMANQPVIARMLLGQGADPNAINQSGSTPLHAAAFLGNTKLAETLINMGANPNATDHFGRTPAVIAQSQGFNALGQFLMSQRAVVQMTPLPAPVPLSLSPFTNPTTPSTNQPAKESNGELTSIQPVPQDIMPPLANASLLVAAKENNLQLVTDLLENGYQINEQDADGNTPLMHAASSGNKEIIDMLLKNKADVTIRNKEGMTAELLAFKAGNFEIAQQLAGLNPRKNP